MNYEKTKRTNQKIENTTSYSFSLFFSSLQTYKLFKGEYREGRWCLETTDLERSVSVTTVGTAPTYRKPRSCHDGSDKPRVNRKVNHVCRGRSDTRCGNQLSWCTTASGGGGGYIQTGLKLDLHPCLHTQARKYYRRSFSSSSSFLLSIFYFFPFSCLWGRLDVLVCSWTIKKKKWVRALKCSASWNCRSLIIMYVRKLCVLDH